MTLFYTELSSLETNTLWELYKISGLQVNASAMDSFQFVSHDHSSLASFPRGSPGDDSQGLGSAPGYATEDPDSFSSPMVQSVRGWGQHVFDASLAFPTGKKKGAFQMGHDYVEKSLGDILRLNLLDNPSYRHPGMAVQLGEYVITVYIATLLLSQRGFCQEKEYGSSWHESAGSIICTQKQRWGKPK